MSLPPYKHTRNSCLQTADEPLILGLSGAPLITHKCVEEKRRTSDQRVARIQNMPGVEFEYEYVPAGASHIRLDSQVSPLSREKKVFEPQIEDHHYQRRRKIESVDLKCVNEQSPSGASGDQLSNIIKDIGQCAEPNDRRNLREAKNDAKSTCSRRSSVSHCSQSSRKSESSSKSKKSERRCDSRESLFSTLNAILKTPKRRQEESEGFCFQEFSKIANGLDDDDLRPRRR